MARGFSRAPWGASDDGASAPAPLRVVRLVDYHRYGSSWGMRHKRIAPSAAVPTLAAGSYQTLLRTPRSRTQTHKRCK